MKKIFTVITLIFLFCNVFTSCNNSFLDEVPNHQLSDVSFWKTEDDVYKYTCKSNMVAVVHIFNKCGNKLFKVFADVILALKI